ncbi:MAG: hypothetical protein QF449_16135, partial [Alphaproteobacteria bacterium]|nr:hypothetical protein [Alphaproteobacteria bacterium]
DEAMVAFERGDYETALEEFRGLAEAGDHDGQIGLGVMYAKLRQLSRANTMITMENVIVHMTPIRG